MALVITGAGGFLGRTIIKRSNREDIVAVSGQSITEYPGITVLSRKKFFESYRFYQNDTLINCAFPTGNPSASQLADGLNFIGRVMEKAMAEGAGGVINISSQSVYSQKRTIPANEETGIEPESMYAIGKYTSEVITNNLCRKIPHTNIRLASLVGLGYDIRLVNRLIKKVCSGENLAVSVCPRTFEFLDVKDAADAILRLVNYEKKDWREVYVLGGTQSYHMEEIAEIILNVYKRYKPKGFEIKKNPGDDNANNSLDSQLIYRTLRWKPKCSLEDSIQETVEDEMKKVLITGANGLLRE